MMTQRTVASGHSVFVRFEGTGFPLIWVHAFPLDSRLFLDHFAIPGVKHIAPDFPGFGSSPVASGFDSIDDYARLVLEVADTLEVETFGLAGVSMGGYVAMSILRIAPQRVRFLVLCDTRETPDTPEGRAGRHELISGIRSSGSTAKVVDGMLPKMLTDTTRRVAGERHEQVKLMMESASTEGVISALGAMASRGDSTDTLEGTRVPALIVVGDEDQITPPEDAERMARLMPHARVVRIPDAAHLANFERPQLFNEIVERFVRNVESPGAGAS